MISGYALKLSLKVRFINNKAQKIDNSTLKTFGLVLASFQVEDKLEKTRFIQETFLFTDLNIKVVIKMLFLTFSNADI